jgi:hypothetical protein
VDRGRLTTYSEKLAMCLRLLGSDQDGEVVAAVRALKRMLRSSGEDLHDLAARVEKPALNDAEMRKIFDAGVEAGIRKAEAVQHGDGEFRAVDGTPPWEDITVWLQHYDDQHDRLTARERDFVNQMAEHVLWREPSERQGRWLLGIFRRLSGRIR